MLDLNPETVYFIINKAQEFQIGNEDSLSEDPDVTDDWDDDAFSRHVDDPAFLELKTTIEDLEPDQQVSLVALMWLGRGDYALEEWERALAQAGDSWNERTAEYLIGTPLLANYLTDGLEQFGFSEDEEE